LKLREKIALGAGAAFGVSFFLPALDNEPGYLCFLDCWGVLTRSDGGHALPLGGWLYYSGFVVANSVFVLLLGALFYPTPFPRVRTGLSLLSLLQVASWFVVGVAHVDKEDHFALRIGYFLWLSAFALLLAAHLVRNPTRNQPAKPAP
jgi:hypothetical protein